MNTALVPVRIPFWRPEYTLPKFLLGKAKWDEVDVVDNAIDLHTLFWNTLGHPSQAKILRKLRCAHAEVWTPVRALNGEYFFDCEETVENSPIVFTGACWTSTMRPPDKGCVVRPASEVFTHPERWYYWEILVHKWLYDKAVEWAQKTVENNPGYGMAEIASFFWLWRINGKGLICSEFTREFLRAACIFWGIKVWSPLLLSYNLYLNQKSHADRIKGPYELATGKIIEL